ncbi:MAG: ligand-binding sensor domain-containing protein [Gemmatimonas sp.]
MRRNRLGTPALIALAALALAGDGTLHAQNALPVTAASPQQTPHQLLRHMHHTAWTRSNDIELAPSGALVQSTDGYLWFASRGMLVRFDGVRFTRIDSLTSRLLQVDSSDVARPLFVDRQGVMWLRRNDGALLHYRDGVFSMGVPPIAKRRSIAAAFEDGAGRVWVEIGATVHRVDGNRIVKAALPAGVPGTGILGIARDNGTGIWIGTQSQGLWHVVGDSAERVPEPSPRTRAVMPIHHARDGRLWAWGPQSLMVFKAGVWSPILFNNLTIAPSSLLEGPNGQMWVSTQNAGVLQINDTGIDQYSKRHGLTDVAVRDAMFDRENNLWVLTAGGIERFYSAPFTSLGASDGVPFEQPVDVFSDHGRGLWVRSTDARVHHVDGGIVNGTAGEIRWSVFDRPPGIKGLPILAARSGSLYLWGAGVGIERLRNGHASTMATVGQLGATVIRAVHEDARGSLWMGFITRDSTPGLARWTNGALKFVSLERVGRPGNVSAIAEDSTGALWVNNTSRPVIYKLRGDSVVARIDSTDGMPAVVTTMLVEGPDSLWMITNRSHLVRVVGGKATRVHFANENPVLAPTWSTPNSSWLGTVDRNECRRGETGTVSTARYGGRAGAHHSVAHVRSN